MISLLFISIICAIIYVNFSWVGRLDSYARYLLVGKGTLSAPTLKGVPNPISQIINQLILNNSILHNDKTELTDQIKKISYVDDVAAVVHYDGFILYIFIKRSVLKIQNG